ncbi:MAG: cell division protein SepF [Coriobacteriales bacterium]|jgi:cell division inhibitor SepF|nr:cell division protein SepF [Coriobacteriales bacterium]
MGILDSVRGRLGLGVPDDDYRDDGRKAAYGDYEDYDERGVYGADPAEGPYDDYGDTDDAPISMTAFGVDRADYYNDSNTPFVSLADVRSHRPEPTSMRSSAALHGRPQATSQIRDRIPEPRVYQRATNAYEASGLDEDALAFRDGLARSDMNSLTELQSERLRLEDTGRFGRVGGRQSSNQGSGVGVGSGVGSAARVGPVAGSSPRSFTSFTSGTSASAAAAPNRPATGGYTSGPGIISGHVRTRGRRRIEYLRPLSYAEAEQVTKRLRGGSVVVLDLTQVRPELAKRILDFSFGVASALDGQVDRHADRVYIFTAKTALTSEERASIRLEM